MKSNKSVQFHQPPFCNGLISRFLAVFSILLSLFAAPFQSLGQSDTSWWHGIKREIHYKPDGEDFVLASGRRRFNRALYGTNTAFRVEAGDLPEFALYMPGMGGNFKFGLINKSQSKWLINAKSIKTTYRPGSMIYEVRDSLFGGGFLQITVLALANAEGIIIKVNTNEIPSSVQLLWAFGGASGKKFSRDGDIGADPESSFYLQPAYCNNNFYKIQGNSFNLSYGSAKVLSEEERYGNKPAGNDGKTVLSQESNLQKHLIGIVPPSASITLADAEKQGSPAALLQSKPTSLPVITGILKPSKNKEFYFLVINPETGQAGNYDDLKDVFAEAEAARKKIADQVKVHTPDPYINTLGGALSIAADAIWEDPSYLHGAVAWRMRLNAWRGPYVADPLGWHDRARKHFSSYAASQVTTPASGPVVADTALHLARQLEKMCTSVFSSGYISRNPGNNKIAHHYDMNLVFIDELLNHFNWTGDTSYVKQMWPLLQRHLAWEKRNFDVDGDGLYDAYAAIWASDALEYSGGGVTHSSAYNYRSNKTAAELATLIGEDPKPYEEESDKILAAMNKNLWMPSKGWYAEYKDLLGLQQLHPAAALWTIYHAIDEKAADGFQAYQSLRYIDTHIPHIPVKAMGLNQKDLYVLSTTNWQPYEWSLNNVALAESQHTALAYWQGGNAEEAYKIWRSSLIESMYLGASPGNFQQLTFYDAIRGELYRDFADPIGVAARALVEGLFGIQPKALKDTLTIQPGWPMQWKFASLKIPDLSIDFKRNNNEDIYTILPFFKKEMNLQFLLRAKTTAIESIFLNGKSIAWKNVNPVGEPVIEIDSKAEKKFVLKIRWKGSAGTKVLVQKVYVRGSTLAIIVPDALIQKVYDPQQVLSATTIKANRLQGIVKAQDGFHTLFLQVKQNQLTWWQPLNFEVKDAVEIIASAAQPKNGLQFFIKNNTSTPQAGTITVNEGHNLISIPIKIAAKSASKVITIPADQVVAGSNSVAFTSADTPAFNTIKNVVNWQIEAKKIVQEKVDLRRYFNDKVTNIFKNQYLSPRPKVPTLQLPTQGIGEWTHPLLTANIDDQGLRNLAGEKNEIVLPQGIIFATPSDTLRSNIAFASQWDNYPNKISIMLSGKASHAYLLMAGSTNPMQSRITNGEVVFTYTDGSSDTLLLKNPETWWPIEQDYYNDGYAFTTGAARPIRIALKTGRLITDEETRTGSNIGKLIDGGAATVLDVPLQANKILKELTLQTLANDVVIGLMSVTLVR